MKKQLDTKQFIDVLTPAANICGNDARRYQGNELFPQNTTKIFQDADNIIFSFKYQAQVNKFEVCFTDNGRVANGKHNIELLKAKILEAFALEAVIVTAIFNADDWQAEIEQDRKEEHERRVKAEQEEEERRICAERKRCREIIDAARVPSRFCNATLDNYDFTGNENAEAVIKAYFKPDADDPEWYCAEGGFLAIEGKVGTGKTHIAAAIVNKLAGQTEPALFITAPEIISEYKQRFSKDNDFEASGKMSRIEHCLRPDDLINFLARIETLVIDDLGTEYLTDHNAAVLQDLINRRYADDMPTIITSNNIDALPERMRSRVLSGYYAPMQGTDYRKKQALKNRQKVLKGEIE